MVNTQTAVQTTEMAEATQEEMRRLIFEAPIAELAEHQGITIDKAVALRVEQNLAATTIPIEVIVALFFTVFLRWDHGFHPR